MSALQISTVMTELPTTISVQEIMIVKSMEAEVKATKITVM